MSKYQVTININGYVEVISTHKTPKRAIERMLKEVKATLLECFKTGYEINTYPTSDSRYPDAWGYANNGYCIKSNCRISQFEVVEIEDR